ncbi:CDP-glycerol glycerophosphotransferase family protein [Arthrobacter crystallopoietes]|uniref:CDP-glycerol glycerophosphotransferase family protein n=1 Tax=Crystallibacter crystallopoietes TaxID=37928 RepID=UPI001ABDD986|nr:CDP-glycerol glycerophosphotransferase family protein [Arthrobacter crystallopoietes]QTG80348.1 CDP-glycerol glycerophosphotransferase family protein [Arthrobacter crystallopoietes]
MSFNAKARRGLNLIADHVGNFLLDKRVRKELDARNSTAPARYEAALYFADDPSSAYQIRQWFGPMLKLSERHPVAVLVHKATTAAAILGDCPLPVYLTSGIDEVERFVSANGTRVVFYVNNNQANFTVLRLTNPVHIHLSHGESDKVSMASNQLKAYDFAFIAGEASRQRILANVPRLDPQKLVEIGRPQLDGAAAQGAQNNHGGRVTVLYAPTWEGDRDAMAYGSVVSHGLPLVRSLLADSRYRLIFRPHPRTGVRLRAHGDAVKQIDSLIASAVENSPDAGHYRDHSLDFNSAMAEADICICDVSAMAMDWLPHRKPLLITKPTEPAAVVDPKGITSVVPLLAAVEAERTPSVLDDLRSRPISEKQLDLIRYHFGETDAGASTRRFLWAVDRAMQEPSL